MTLDLSSCQNNNTFFRVKPACEFIALCRRDTVAGECTATSPIVICSPLYKLIHFLILANLWVILVISLVSLTLPFDLYSSIANKPYKLRKALEGAVWR